MQNEEWTDYFSRNVWLQGCLIDGKPLSTDQWKRLKRKHNKSVQDHPISGNHRVRMRVELARKLNADFDRMDDLSKKK